MRKVITGALLALVILLGSRVSELEKELAWAEKCVQLALESIPYADECMGSGRP